MTGEKVTTPCVNLCKLDQFSGLCVGCGRTRAEIAGWKKMTEHERLAIMRLLAERPGFASVQRVADRGELVGDLRADRSESGDQPE
jgi:uncharacterized protein